MAQQVAPHNYRHAAVQLAFDNTSPGTVKLPFWYMPETVNAVNWNKSFPYQLLVVRRTAQNTYVPDTKWAFTLPIPPQSLQISMPFAIDLALTFGGVVEQHSGVPIRIISLSGTTGVLPLRGSAPPLRPFTVAESIFAGTLQQAQNVASAVSDLTNDLVPTNKPTNLVKESDIKRTTEVGRTSGYFQFRLLQRFLERYAEFKKTPEGKDYRLAFAIWKDEAIYLVTPTEFTVRRSVPAVWEYQYSLSFKAWRRVTLTDSSGNPVSAPRSNESLTPIARNPDKMSRALKAIQDARRIIHGSIKVLYAVAGDLANAVLNPLREVSLFLKDGVGAAIAMADLPKEIIRSAKTAVIELLSVRDAFQAAGPIIAASSDSYQRDIDELKALGALLSKSDTKAGDLTSALGMESHPGNRIFDEPDAHYDLFSAIRPGDLHLSIASVNAIVRERQRVERITRSDFEQARDAVRRVADIFSDAVGVGNEVYNKTYSRAVTAKQREATDDDFEVLFALNQAAIELDHLAASADTNRFAVSSMEYVAGLATRSGIAFRVPRSKFAVPFPYRGTLERLAERHLGDPNRWQEIATLNGLRPPYIDEEGYEIPLITNASGTRVTVADPKHLRAGQVVTIYSRVKPRLKCSISSIDIVSSSMAIITLDQDVSIYKLSDGATLHAFLPDTVNCRQVIYIPSDNDPGEEDYQTKGVPGLDEFDPMLRVAGQDLLITQAGDLVVTPDGDTPVAQGLTNITQYVRIALSVPKGTLLHHPEFGLAVPVGVNTADLDPQQLADAARDLFDEDPTFTGIQSVAVSKSGPSSTLAVAVGVRGVSKFIPISVDVNRSTK